MIVPCNFVLCQRRQGACGCTANEVTEPTCTAACLVLFLRITAGANAKSSPPKKSEDAAGGLSGRLTVTLMAALFRGNIRHLVFRYAMAGAKGTDSYCKFEDPNDVS